MKEQAMQKIEKEKCEGPVAELQQMIMCWIAVDERAAGLILAENKTVAGAYKAMEDVARKVKSGNHAVIDPPKAMAIVMEYMMQRIMVLLHMKMSRNSVGIKAVIWQLLMTSMKTMSFSILYLIIRE